MISQQLKNNNYAKRCAHVSRDWNWVGGDASRKCNNGSSGSYKLDMMYLFHVDNFKINSDRQHNSE